MRTRLWLAVLATLLPAAAARAQITFPIGPRSAYIRTSNDSPTAPEIRTLASLGVAPGDFIRIRVLGEYSYNTSGAIDHSAGAVFSSSSTLLATDVLARVPGAIDAGEDAITGNTYYNALPTDIPQDFPLADNTNPTNDYTDVVVPQGAVYLFVGVLDSLYYDNLDSDDDFAAEVTLLCAAGQCCDPIDFNGDGLFPDTQDITDFLSVFAGGVCSGQLPADPPCNIDIDFNNDGLFPDTDDITAFIRVFAGGPCV